VLLLRRANAKVEPELQHKSEYGLPKGKRESNRQKTLAGKLEGMKTSITDQMNEETRGGTSAFFSLQERWKRGLRSCSLQWEEGGVESSISLQVVGKEIGLSSLNREEIAPRGGSFFSKRGPIWRRGIKRPSLLCKYMEPLWEKPA